VAALKMYRSWGEFMKGKLTVEGSEKNKLLLGR